MWGYRSQRHETRREEKAHEDKDFVKVARVVLLDTTTAWGAGEFGERKYWKAGS